MRVAIDSELVGRVRAAWSLARGLSHAEAPGFRDEVARVAATLAERCAGLKPAQIPQLEPARALYRAVGMDPTRHRPSSEALLRRVLQGKGLYRLDPVVDTGNLFSLASGLPLGLYDLAHVAGDATLRLGREGESFPGIRKGDVNVAGRLCLADAEGPFGSPSSDSSRCRVRESTAAVLYLVYAPWSASPEGLLARAAELGGMFARWNGAAPEKPRLLPEA